MAGTKKGKKTTGAIEGPSAFDERRYQAEQIVRTSMQNSPAFKKAVTQTMKELAGVERRASSTLRGKPSTPRAGTARGRAASGGRRR